jgi:hypothetical protein
MPTRVSDGRELTALMAPPADDGGTPVLNYELQLMLPGEVVWTTVLGDFGDGVKNLQMFYVLGNEELLPS